MATKTLQNARDIYYAILKETEDSSAYPLVLCDELINNSQRGICSGNLTDLVGGRKEQLEKGPLPFLFLDKYYTSVSDSTLDTAAVIGASTLSMSDSSGFDTAGDLYINEDLVTYTGNTGTGFTGVTGIDFAHLSGARVSQLFTLPTDFATSNRVIYNNQIALRSEDYRNIYIKLNNYKGNYFVSNTTTSTLDRFPSDIPPFYCIISGTYFLPFQLSEAGYMYHMMYEKKPTELTAGSTVMTIPDEYSMSTAPVLAAAYTLYNRGEEARALQLQNFALGKVLEMYSYYTDQNSEDMNNQRIETGQDAILNI